MPQFSKSLTSAVRVILGFQGVLGIVAAGVACAPSSGRVVHSGSSGVVKGMSICRWGCFVSSDARAAMQQFCKSMITDWLHPFKPTR